MFAKQIVYIIQFGVESDPSGFKRPATVAQDVYRHLRARLLAGELPGGSRLREQEVATELAVSRTPVREAIRQLAQEGLVTLETNRGVRVHEPDLAEATATYEVRERLEAMAARLAAVNADDRAESLLEENLAAMLEVDTDDYAGHIEADNEFHRSIAGLSGNPVLVEMIERLNTRVNRVKVLTRHANSSELAHGQHRAIVDAIVGHDPELAEQRMAEHIRTNLSVVRQRFDASYQHPTPEMKPPEPAESRQKSGGTT